jgi:hypothetical protein
LIVTLALTSINCRAAVMRLPHMSKAAIKLSYRRLSRLYHPDLNSSPTSDETAQNINVAFMIIDDSMKAGADAVPPIK